MCVEKCRTWVLFRLQVSEKSDMVSLKMGVRFAASFNMGEILLQKLYIITCRNQISGQISHKTHKIHKKQTDIE